MARMPVKFLLLGIVVDDHGHKTPVDVEREVRPFADQVVFVPILQFELDMIYSSCEIEFHI